MDLQEFQTEDQCLAYLFHLRWPNGYHCPRCLCNEKWDVGHYKYKCRKCGYQTTVTSGTLFHDTHMSLILWFRAIYYVTSGQKRITALGLQKELGLGSYRIALTLFNKLRRAMISPTLNKLRGTIEVEQFIVRMGNQTSQIALAVEINNKKVGQIRMGKIGIEHYKHPNDFVKSCIEEGSTILTSGWGNCNKLYSNGYIGSQKLTAYSFPYLRSVRSKFEKWLCHSTSSADISTLLDEYCRQFNTLTPQITFQELLYNAIHLQPTPYADNPLK